jgi:hypothetical protein
MSPEEDRDGTNGRPASASTAGHDCERVRRFIEEHAREDLARIHPHRGPRLGQHHRSTSAAAPMLSDAFGHGLRGTGASVIPLKGTDATASRHVRGTLRGRP